MTESRNNNPRPGEYVAAFMFVLAVALLLILSSCSPRIVEHLQVQHDTTYVNHTQVDSVFRRDSVYIREKNDTVYQYVERIRERYRLIHDTTYVHQVDTVMREHVVEKKVEKPLTPWQNFRMQCGTIALAVLLLAAVLWAVRKFILKR